MGWSNGWYTLVCVTRPCWILLYFAPEVTANRPVLSAEPTHPPSPPRRVVRQTAALLILLWNHRFERRKRRLDATQLDAKHVRITRDRVRFAIVSVANRCDVAKWPNHDAKQRLKVSRYDLNTRRQANDAKPQNMQLGCHQCHFTLPRFTTHSIYSDHLIHRPIPHVHDRLRITACWQKFDFDGNYVEILCELLLFN